MNKITFEFACLDDCLDKMVPSDLREVVAERDRLRERNEALEELVVGLEEVRSKEYEFKQARIEALEKGLQAVAQLIEESSGVSGLHMNGDVAPWSDLQTGGRFEEWLIDFDAALLQEPTK